MKQILMIVGGAALTGAVSIAQIVNQAGRDWPYHPGDQGGTRFSTLTQINVANVSTLKRAWTFHTGSGRFASSPMVIDSVMYFSAPDGVYAVDAVTGRQIWKYVPGGSAAPPAATLVPEGEAAAPPRGGGGGRGAGGDGSGRGTGGGGGGRGAGRGGESAGTALRGPA